MSAPSPNANRNLALNLIAIVLGMVMLAYASVPLYQLFCRVTGFGGKAEATQKAPSVVLERNITVRFDANVNGALPWTFTPEDTSLTVRIGEEKHTYYKVKNVGDTTVTGNATFNVLPTKAGIYFNKIQCFCFNELTLKPGETRELDVTFFVDPMMAEQKELDDVHTITLSYTFFPVDKK